MIPKMIVLSIIMLLKMGCAKTTATDMDQLEIEWRTIGKGILGGAGQEDIPESRLVISNEADWQALQAKMDAVNPETKTFTELDIDFDKYLLLAVFDAVRSSGGYDIEITQVKPTEERVLVSVMHTRPGPVSTNVFTQPYHIVKMEHTDKEIVFEQE